eukprot:2192791-Pleurochrysis_carterae.AAC.1
MSAVAASDSTRPQRPSPVVMPMYVPARVSDASGLCPRSSLTTGASCTPAVKMLVTSWSTSSCTAGVSLSSPTTLTTRARASASMCSRATTT